MTKLQIALTDQEAANLSLSAMRLGYSLTRFVKFLLGQAAFKAAENIPVYKMSAEAIGQAEAAWEEYKQGKTVKIDSIEKYLKQNGD
ncbi:MAG: hypothetical protein V1810_02485 [Candidatus Beckwithbacteria bacterium]